MPPRLSCLRAASRRELLLARREYSRARSRCASLNHCGHISQIAEQTAELAKKKPQIPILAWAGVRSFASHCFDCAKAISTHATGGVIEESGHWVFEEKTEFICGELKKF
jgi:pimeloyl-ACP methyl ester carboxylesterase